MASGGVGLFAGGMPLDIRLGCSCHLSMSGNKTVLKGQTCENENYFIKNLTRK